VTRGKDALGEAFVHVVFNDRNYTGKAASTDLIDASARAYLNAVNKALHERRVLGEVEVRTVPGRV
jgi:2-isopropylmalate synthase